MTGSLIFQIFLLFNVFIMGALAAIAARHAYAHFRPHSDSRPPRPKPPAVHLPPDVRQRLIEAATAKFQASVEHANDQLQHTLVSTTEGLNKQLEKLGTEIVRDEMQRYHANLDQLREHANVTLNGAQKQMAAHQEDLEAKLAKRQEELETKLVADMTEEKQRLSDQLDAKLADAVASFLAETLQHNVDLGAQGAYLTKLLEEHKDDLKREVLE